MDYVSLNENNRKRMQQICTSDFKMDWEDAYFFDTMIGKLPSIHSYGNDETAYNEIQALKEYYSKYDYFSTDRKTFVKELKELIETINDKMPSWYGLDLYRVEESIRQHEFCLIYGEGGIGKSYFIKCLEEEFACNNIPHLCIYGKFEKNLNNVDMNEIVKMGESGFVFMVDAINEMSETGQLELLNLIPKLMEYSGIRIILSYRTNSMDFKILARYEELAKAQYAFPGVSFESALSELIKLSVPDVYKYEDILFSNNALLLSMLCKVLSEEKIIEEKVNGVSSITYILEYYVKNSIKKSFRGVISSTAPIEIWNDIKRVAKWMYANESKSIDKNSLLAVVLSGEIFISVLKQAGIINEFSYNETRCFSFSIDSLTDYLIARSLFDDISGKPYEEQVRIISKKSGELYSMVEAIIIAIFDNMSPNYELISKLLTDTKLIDDFRLETLLKIRFEKKDIPEFVRVFNPTEKSSLITLFGGYTDKPFNSVNYLNLYYKDRKKQLKELSSELSGEHFLNRIKGRLKNLIYFIAFYGEKNGRAKEAFYFALWCSSAPNMDIRSLAVKLLFEVTRTNQNYKSLLIDNYKGLFDPYIKEAVIWVLANYVQDDAEIMSFFKNLISTETCMLSRSIKRIASYMHDDYGYIKWNVEDLFDEKNKRPISDAFNDILHGTDLMKKDYMPFRYWSRDRIDYYTRFLAAGKQEILKINLLLRDKYTCVKKGECNGSFSFEKNIKSKYMIESKWKTLDEKAFLASFEVIIKNVFALFGEPFEANGWRGNEIEFINSVLFKCVDIATAMYYGSLMCNYFTDRFATFNTFQDNIGYDVYDPLEYGEDMYLNSPVPVFQDYVEKIGDIVVGRIEIPEEKNLEWVKNMEITRKNVISFLEPVTFRGEDWILLAGRVSLHNEEKGNTMWKDTYDIWCCTSEKETIKQDENARTVTIELDDYAGNMDDYLKCTIRSWFCKNVKNIKYNSELFDETSLVLPPADLLSFFKLNPVCTDMSWIDQDGEKVIICNNNKNSYYRDPIGGTVYIKKKFLDKYLSEKPLKYFAFAERYIPETGYADETSLHFEIQDGKIIKEIPNNLAFGMAEDVTLCKDCPHGLKDELPDAEVPNAEEIRKMLNIIFDLKYKEDEEDD